MRKLLAASLVVAFVAGLAACGERPQVVTYKQGTYQGKPDTQPWSNPPYNGNKEQWEQAIRTRMQSQNEYKRAS
jgi:flagellar basal body L-ring protein FlgH